MTNLLKETKADIKNSGHKVSDIIFIGSIDSGYSCTWDEFLTLADIEYHAGFGYQEIASDLTIVFSDGSTMWRGEYDGSEWWEYSKPAEIPENQKQILKLNGGFWTSLEALHENSDDD